MATPIDPIVFNWLANSEALIEIKEESVEIKEEPFDDMADTKQEDLTYFFPNGIKKEAVKNKEDVEELADIKEEEPVIHNESLEIKEEPIDSLNKDIKDEELSTLPIADVFCPSTGNSRPLTIDLGEGMHSRNQIAPPRYIKATKTVTVKGPGTVARDVVIKLDRSQPSFGISPLDTVATCAAPVAPKRTRISQSPSRHTLHHQLQFNGFNSSSLPFGEQDETADAKAPQVAEKQIYSNPRSGRASEPPLKCNHCTEYAVPGLEMASHMKACHPDVLPTLFATYQQLAHHIKKPTMREDDSRHGNILEMDGDAPSINSEELEKIRVRMMVEKCDYCDGFYKIGGGMTYHVRSKHYHELNRMLKKCTFCDSSFSLGTEMNNHVRSMHSEEFEKSRHRLQLTQCSFCDCFLKKGTVMESHVRSKHSEELRRRQSKDKQLAKVYGLPFSAAEIADMSLPDLQKVLKDSDSLTEPQRELMKQIHRRGKRSSRFPRSSSAVTSCAPSNNF